MLLLNFYIFPLKLLMQPSYSFLPEGSHRCIYPLIGYKGSFFTTTSPVLVYNFLDISYSHEFIMVWTFISQILSNTDNFFLCLWKSCRSSLKKCLVRLFIQFFQSCLPFCWVVWIFWMQHPVKYMWDINYFPQMLNFLLVLWYFNLLCKVY